MSDEKRKLEIREALDGLLRDTQDHLRKQGDMPEEEVENLVLRTKNSEVYCVAVGEKLGKSEEQLEQMRWLALTAPITEHHPDTAVYLIIFKRLGLDEAFRDSQLIRICSTVNALLQFPQETWESAIEQMSQNEYGEIYREVHQALVEVSKIIHPIDFQPSSP